MTRTKGLSGYVVIPRLIEPTSGMIVPPEITQTDSPFTKILAELQALHDKKQADYGRPGDPLANVRASEDFGVPAWVGALIRANDKMRRLQKAAAGGTLVNEGVDDSLRDLAVYAILALLLWRESH